MSGMVKKKSADRTALLASTTADTATNALGASINLPRPPNGLTFVLYTTAKASAVDDTLDVYVDTKIGSYWVPVVHFTQQLGNGTDAQEYVAKIVCDGAEAEFEIDAVLAAAAVRDIFGDKWRARYSIVAGAGTHEFTFGVDAIAF